MSSRSSVSVSIAFLALTSAAYLWGAPVAGATGSYNCCGDSNCTILSANERCPNGSTECTGDYTNCCNGRCND